MSLVRKDDGTSGEIAAEANPLGWLVVRVKPIGGAELPEQSFSSWESFRHWVELSDPGCGQILDPPT